MNSELHLFIIWGNYRDKEAQILAEIAESFNIVEIYDVNWQKKHFVQNLSRFYGVKLTSLSSKLKECGKSPFLLIIVRDDKPVYGLVETSRGSEYVNTNVFNAKQHYRHIVGGGSRIHGTNTPAETEHDITLLLGKNTKDYIQQAPKTWSGDFKKTNKDIVGANGWESLAAFFYVLNATTDYLVMRNFEYLPQNYVSKEHGDIDLLVEDLSNTVLISNAQKVVNQPHRVHYAVQISGERVLFDFRYLGDNYYHYDLQHDMLANRVLHQGFYTPNKLYYFYTLTYHALIHKRKIATDYYTKLDDLYRKCFPKGEEEVKHYIHPFDLYFSLLKKFMKEKGYGFVQPKDTSVFYDAAIVNAHQVVKWLEKRRHLKDIQVCLIHKKTHSGFMNLIAETETGEKVFIKWGGIGHSSEKEYFALKKLYARAPRFFPKPLFYKNDGDCKYVVMTYIHGESLQHICEHQVAYDSQKLCKQMIEIATILQEEKLIHRDIKLDNCLLDIQGNLRLIDFQFVLSPEDKRFRECKELTKHVSILRHLGIREKNYMWDDIYAFEKVVGTLTLHEENKSVFNSTLSALQAMKGKLVVRFVFKNYFRLLIGAFGAFLYIWNKQKCKQIWRWGQQRKAKFLYNQ